MPPRRTIQILLALTAVIWIGSFLYFESAYPPEITAQPAETVFREKVAKREQDLQNNLEALRVSGASNDRIATAHLDLADHYLSIEAYDEADDQCEAARHLIALNAQSISACDFCNRLGNMHELRNKYWQADEDYARAQEVFPEDTSVSAHAAKARTYNNHANLFLIWAQTFKEKDLRQKKLESAETYFRMALSELNTYPEWNNSLEGQALARTICTSFQLCLTDLGKTSEIPKMLADANLKQ